MPGEINTSLVPSPPVSVFPPYYSPQPTDITQEILPKKTRKKRQPSRIPDAAMFSVLGQMSIHEPALVGMNNIAKLFNKYGPGFWNKHSKELKHFNIVFKLYCKRDHKRTGRVCWAAFPDDLRKWAHYKASKKEVI